MQPLVLSGARVLIRFNNTLFAAGFIMDYLIETAETTVQGIDNVFPDELAPQNINVSMTLKVFRTPDNDPVALGIAPGGDTLKEGGSPQVAFTTSPYITVEIRDRVTDRTVLFLPQAWVHKRSGSAESESLLTETWSIKSIGFFGSGGQTSSVAGTFGNLG